MGHLADGMTVFVPRTAPGDRVVLAHLRRRRRHARAEAAELLERSKDRVEPACRHFEREGCGGCQWQHLSLEAQHRSKRRMVGDALRRLGGLAVEDPELVASPKPFGYRATITLTVRWRGSDPVVGFHRATGEGEGAGEVFPLERCEIAREEVAGLWAAVRPALGSLPRGEDVRLKLRVAHDGTLHLIVNGGDRAWTTPQPLADAARQAGCPATVWWQPPGGAVRRMAGPAADKASVAFEQVNAEVAGALRAAVLDAVPPEAHEVLDLYAGTGEVALALARRGCEVTSVEAEDAAVRLAEERARVEGLSVRAVAARVEDRLAGLLPADAVVVNPPRTGLAPEVTAALAGQPPAALVYVSCDPATLARDLKRLGASPERLILRCFDMFPQTSHVETLAILRR
ncbi:MAG: methyltransferase domain-containing protein [Gemmatimonadales bacterium]